MSTLLFLPVLEAVLEAILEAAAKEGASAASWIMLRLPREVSLLFQEWLCENFPDRAKRVMARVRECHGGQDYDPDWGRRLSGQGLYAELIRDRFDKAIKRVGLVKRLPPLRTDVFRRIAQPGDQLSLF